MEAARAILLLLAALLLLICAGYSAARRRQRRTCGECTTLDALRSNGRRPIKIEPRPHRIRKP